METDTGASTDHALNHDGDPASNTTNALNQTTSSDTVNPLTKPTESISNEDQTMPQETTPQESTPTEDDKPITDNADTLPEEKKQATLSSDPSALPSCPSLNPATVAPMVPNPMTPLNPMMMPPMMPGMPGMAAMNAPPMMPGFAPYPFMGMPGGPAMLPFMAGLNPNAMPTTANTNKTKTGKRCGEWQSYITEKGKTYYFNVVTKVNTWDKPKQWIDEDTPSPNKLNESQPESTSNESSVLPSSDSNQDTAKSSKDGYLGTAATKELAVIKDNVAKRSFGTMHQSKYKDRSERVKAFRALLKDRQIESDWNWKKVLPKIVTDRRYNALTKLDDKKNELVLWQQDEKKRIQDEEREKRHQMKSGYFALLDEFIDKVIRKEYRKAKHYLESDDRFMQINSKHRREEWFDEWQGLRYKEYKKERKKKKESALKEFAERLKSCEVLTLDCEWLVIRPKLSFVNEAFMEQLSDRNQEKIFNEIMDELIEKDKEEKRRQFKQDRKRFGELMDELLAKKVIHVKCRYGDAEVMEAMQKDERYKKMSEHMHEMKNIFHQKMDDLKDELKEDKKIFKQFMRTKELMIGMEDTWRDMVPRFKKVSENHSIGGKISEDHLEHLLAEYVYKKRKDLKHNSGKNVNGKELNVVVNTKKRDRNDMEHQEEEEEPQKKRQKIDKKYVDVTIHDPASYKQKKEDAMDEGEIEELEEGELSDVDIIDNKIKYKMHKEGEEMDEKTDNHHRNGHCVNRKRSNSLSSRYSASLSPSRSPKSNRSRSKSSDLSSHGSRSRSRSSNYSFDSNDSNHRKASKKRHKKGGKRHRSSSHRNHRKYDRNHRHHGGQREEKKHSREHKKHNREHKENKKKQRERKRERQREKESSRVKDNNIDNILYGITSDIDEQDLYYRGDIKRSDQISYEEEVNHEDTSLVRSNVNSNANNNINNRKRHQRRGGLHQWNNNNPRRHHHHHHHYKHHDLDYSNSYSLNDHEINADSYNLDNDEMARWNQ